MQRGEEPVNFFSRVVVHKADAQHAATGLDAEPLAQVKRVIVPVPGEYPTLTEVACQITRAVPRDSNGDGGHALSEARRIFDSVKREAGNGQEAADEPLHQGALIGANHIVSGEQGGSARGGRRRGSPAKLGEVIDRRSDSCLAFVVLGAGLPAVGILL